MLSLFDADEEEGGEDDGITRDLSRGREEGERSEGESAEQVPPDPDKWIVTEHLVVRVHRRPSLEVSNLDHEELPISLKDIGIVRNTRTNLDNKVERYGGDVLGQDPPPVFSDTWVGKTTLNFLLSESDPGYEWVVGRLTEKRAETTRPGDT